MAGGEVLGGNGGSHGRGGAEGTPPAADVPVNRKRVAARCGSGYQNRLTAGHFPGWQPVLTLAGAPQSGRGSGIGISASAGSGAHSGTRWATTSPITTIDGEAKASARARSASSARGATSWRWPRTVPC